MPSLNIDWAVYIIDLLVNPPTVRTFDSSDGTPADAMAFQDWSVLGIYEKIEGGQSTARIYGASWYIRLDLQSRWSPSDLADIARLEAAGVSISAKLEGLAVPPDIWRSGEAVMSIDDRFPSPAGKMAYRVPDEFRPAAAFAAGRAVELSLDGVTPLRLTTAEGS